jgi:hypothetical protein
MVWGSLRRSLEAGHGPGMKASAQEGALTLRA